MSLFNVLLLLLPLRLSAAQSRNDWEQCYYAKSAHAHPSLYPCLKPKDTPVSWCCFAGHDCVNHACWDPSSGVTYQYGCNDVNYEHENCPRKGGLDMGKSPWVGLVRCNDTHNEGTQKYWACNHPDTCGEHCPVESNNPQVTQSVWPNTIQDVPPVGFCDELGTRVLALYGPVTLGSTGGVPSSVNTQGAPQMTRPLPKNGNTTPTSVSITMVASEILSSGILPSGTPELVEGTRTEGTAAALSGGTIAGIVVGSALAVLLFLAAFSLLWRRRRAMKSEEATPSVTPDNMSYRHAPQVPPAELPQNERQLYQLEPDTPSTVSDTVGMEKRQVDTHLGVSSPSPLSSPRTPGSPFFLRAPGTHELFDTPRALYELPAINERSEMP